MVGTIVGWVTTVGIVVGAVIGTVVGTVVGGSVGTAVGSVVGIVVGSVIGEVVFPPIIIADTDMVHVAQNIRIKNIMKNRSFKVSLPVL